MNIQDLDLNLLKVFDAILKEQSLTKAAKAMALSQPAISHSLAKLRDFFKDPLFVRQGNVMAPTQRAKAISKNIGKSLDIITKALEDKGQADPRKSSRTFVIGITNYGAMALLPDLLSELEEQAPGIRIITQHLTLEQKTRFLEDSSIDLAIGCARPEKAGIKEQAIFSDKEVCVVGKSTPVADGYISHSNIGDFSLIRYQVSQQESTDLFCILDDKKISYQSTFTTDQEFLIPQVVTKTGHIGIVAEKIALRYQKGFDFDIYPIKDVETRFTIRQFWHMRQDNDHVHRWFRKLIKDIGNRLDQG